MSKFWCVLRRALVALVAAVVALGCVPFHGYVGDPQHQKLAILGDSILSLTTPALTDRLAASWRLSIDGISGYRVDELQPTAELDAAVDGGPDVVGIELGTNDAFQRWLLADSKAALETMIDTFGPSRCLVLVTVNARTFDAPVNEWATSWNGWLHSLTAGDPRIRIADWDQLVKAYYDDGQREGDLTYDLVHPTQLGQQKLADLVRDTITTCP